jgi:hypothetical protein
MVGAVVATAERSRRVRYGNVRGELSLNCASIFTGEKKCVCEVHGVLRCDSVQF